MANACAETCKGCVLSQLVVNIIHKVICATKICLGGMVGYLYRQLKHSLKFKEKWGHRYEALNICIKVH